MTAAAVLVVILAIVVGRAAWKKPNAGARLAALLGLIIALWLILAAADPGGAGLMATDAAKGVMQLMAGIGHLLRTAPGA